MDQLLNLELLQTFLAVAEAGELKKASEALFKSHSAVSMQIQRLESLTGSPVFHRNSRGVTLTRKGELLQSYARRMLHLNHTALAAIQRDTISGQMRFGIPTDYAQTFIRKLLPALKSALPNLQARVVCERSRVLRKKIQARELDMALVAGEPGLEDEQIIWGERLVWVGAVDYEFAPQGEIPVALFNGDCIVRDLCLAGLKQCKFKSTTVFSSPDIQNIAHAVYDGIGISLLPESLAPEMKTRELPADALKCTTPMTMNLIHSDAIEPAMVNLVTGQARRAFVLP